MKCPRCSYVSQDKSPKFCSNCGNKLEQQADSPKALVVSGHSEDARGIYQTENSSLSSMSETNSLPPDLAPEVQSPELSNQSVSLGVVSENQHENRQNKKKRRKKKKKNPASVQQSASLFFSDSSADYYCAPEEASKMKHTSEEYQPEQAGGVSEPSESAVDCCINSGSLDQGEKENQSHTVHQFSSSANCKAAKDTVSASNTEQKPISEDRSKKCGVEKSESSSNTEQKPVSEDRSKKCGVEKSEGSRNTEQKPVSEDGSKKCGVEKSERSSNTEQKPVSEDRSKRCGVEKSERSSNTEQKPVSEDKSKKCGVEKSEEETVEHSKSHGDENPPTLENDTKIIQDVKEKEDDYTAAVCDSESMSETHSRSKNDQTIAEADCKLGSSKQDHLIAVQEETRETGKVKPEQKDSKGVKNKPKAGADQKRDDKLESENQSKAGAPQPKTSEDGSIESSSNLTEGEKSDSGDEFSSKATVKEDVSGQKRKKDIDENVAASSNQTSKKNKKQQKNESAAAKRNEFPSAPKTEGVTIYFHAVLSKDFKIDIEKDKVVIRSDKLAENWNIDVTEMNLSRELGEHGFLIEGQTVVPKELLNQNIPYKYYIKSKNKSYEFIYKCDASEGVHVNRCLRIVSKHLNQGGEWHQYDDIICAQPSGGMHQWIRWIRTKLDLEKKRVMDGVVNGKKIAGRIMLESIFNILTVWNTVNLKSFHDQLHQFFFVYSNPMVYENVGKKWNDLHFGSEEVKELLQNCIQKMVMPFLESDSNCTVQKDAIVNNRLKAGLLSLILTIEFDLLKSKEDVHKVCKLLCIVQGKKEELCKELLELKEVFSVIPRMSQYLTQLCQKGIEDDIDSWILVLPILHLFSLHLKPFQPLSAQELFKLPDVWAGLQGIPFADFRSKKKYIFGIVHLHYGLNFSEDAMQNKKLVSLANQHLESALKATRLWIKNKLNKPLTTSYWGDSLKNELGMWDTFAGLNFRNEHWETLLMSDLEGRIKQVDPVSLISLYCKEYDTLNKLNSLISGCFEKCAITAVQDAPAGSIFQKLTGYNLVKFGNLISAIIEKSWPKDSHGNFVNSCEDVLPHLLEWPDTQNIFHLQGADAKIIDKLTNKAKELLDTAIAILETTVDGLLSGNIYVQYVECILKNQKNFLKIYELKNKPFLSGEVMKNKISAMESVLLLRRTELEKLVEEKLWVESLLKMCKNIAVSVKDINGTDSNGQNMSHSPLDSRISVGENEQPSTSVDSNTNRNNEISLWLNNNYVFSTTTKTTTGDNKKTIELLTEKANELNLVVKNDSAFTNNDFDYHRIFKSIDENMKTIKDRKFKKLERDINSYGQGTAYPAPPLSQQWGVKLTRNLIICFVFAVETGELEMRHLEDFSSKYLNEVVDVRMKNGDMKPNGDVTVKYFDLNDQVKDMAKTMHTFKDSHVFQICWENEARGLASEEADMEESSAQTNSVMELSEVYTLIFDPCYERYNLVYHDLRNASLTFSEVDSILRDYKDQYEDLKKDLLIMSQLETNSQKGWIDERVQQIQQYHLLHLAVESARVIMDVRSALNVTGDFRILQNLLSCTEESFKEERLDYISEDLVETRKLLQEITDVRRLCLHELGQRKNFINWVKEALEDINELKVFVDLASISAGENDLDVDRVACFHDAVLGYSSLLYELSSKAGFKEFMKCLQKLWKALDSDRNLPKKLRDSARHLEWLKTVKDSHGSVELSSLSLATAINERGIYVVSGRTTQKPSLESVLTLKLPEIHDDSEEIRQYTLEDLRELQSKLMLMSGKGEGQNEVDQFSEVFSNVQRLATSFINLYSAGNMLFRNWEAQVFCSSESKACVIMDFNLETLGKIKSGGCVTELLPVLCKKMEIFLKCWKQFMDEKRCHLYYLNYFTAEQLVYLSKELGKMTVSEEALTMLLFINPICTGCDVRDALDNLELDEKCGLLNSESKMDFSLSSFSTESQGYSIEDMQLYLLTEETLESKLGMIWDCYVSNMTSFLPDCLNIDSLGKFLAVLSSMAKMTVNRDLPPGLQEGCPNLIVCTHSDILTTALSIYMQNLQQSLPSYDEVLLCTADTTYEQVELFLRRCLTKGYQGKKIYTMLYADELSYDVSYKSEQLFQQLQSQCMENCRLVIICNCDREHCYMPSAFSQYKVHIIPQQPLKNIQAYLQNHYRVAPQMESAAAVFKERMFVGIVSSKRAGVGKSLYVKRMHEKLQTQRGNRNAPLKTIRITERQVDESKLLQAMRHDLDLRVQNKPVIFHFDITCAVSLKIYDFILQLLLLMFFVIANGKTWVRNPCHSYVCSCLARMSSVLSKSGSALVTHLTKFSFLDVFPKITCRAPKEVLEMEMNVQEGPSQGSADPLMNREEFRSEAFQRPYQYLRRFNLQQNLDNFNYLNSTVEGSPVECLQLFLIYCGVMDPSWLELRNFACFLNLQLKNCETSVFCNASYVGDTLQGFKNFVVNFMIVMARDFATPSLNISDQSPGRQTVNLDGVREEDIAPFQIRKKWESEPHPYIFFNDDNTSMTFIGFHLRSNANGGIDAVTPKDGRIIKQDVMTKELYQGLLLQRVPFNIDFDALPRWKKIECLCMVLGIQWPIDPDETYELTTDNVMKILAIHMRFRCGIPVIIMGETGCGKTRLVKYLCDLRRSGAIADNMKLVKVHGGTSARMIYDKIKEAETLALYNKQNDDLDTVLFFDEANTTEAIFSIKEALCDRTVEGEPLAVSSGLQIIAACNPYRKHTDRMITRLESAGLGYRVKADETDDRLGSIPLRQLVYRVQALPPSMIPLVWDFGQLNDTTEKVYILQIVQRLVKSTSIPEEYTGVITDVLSASQRYMRERRDECSFVSLRDVERCIEVLKWFYEKHEMLSDQMKLFLDDEGHETDSDKVIWSLLLAVGVCYYASLEYKRPYRRAICKYLPDPYHSESTVMREISLIQDLLLNGVILRDTIAKNSALKENVFMMVICIELKIPLFLVGKPGSSKSLAKTIVADAMQGQAAHSDLFKALKQIHLVSFQCSPHSTPEGIINTFRQCARFQEGKNLEDYVSVVVLDEIGLAEDSHKMPLKTLHPLLEDGCIDDDPVPHKKVGFVGISNWALDPAKMNRGIFVSRGDPDKNELIKSAKGICSSDKVVLKKVESFFPPFADAYLEICTKQTKEFFGLRDYYSLIKMVFAVTKASKQEPSAEDILHAVLRNFSGKDDVDAIHIFMSKLRKGKHMEEISTIDMIHQNMYASSDDGECRYLLILTKNYAALQILHQAFFTEEYQPEIIFGSSFPKDQEYTQICRNINRVKICMETGRSVVLLNLQNLYESLYDALNQYYVFLGGQKYVDLGLGTHRVKCRVHAQFRLIVIEEKEVVYKQFPIPLINRLEKHYLDINTVLNKQDKDLVQQLEAWVKQFCSVNSAPVPQNYSPSDVFIGYHSDACASVILQVTERLRQSSESSDTPMRILEEAQFVLLNSATPDSVVRLGDNQLDIFTGDELFKEYFVKQKHSSLVDFIHHHTHMSQPQHSAFTEVTTFSRLMTGLDIESLEEVNDIIPNVLVLSLQQFDTEYSFLKSIRNFLENDCGNKVLIIQSDFEDGYQSTNLIASAKYSAINEINKALREEVTIFVYFITKLPRVEGGTSYVGFHGGLWQSVHIDDLRRSEEMCDVTTLKELTISQLFEDNTDQPEPMIVDNDEESSEVEHPLQCRVLETTSLVRSCVQSAVGMLRDHEKNASRGTKRVEILLTLLSEDGEFKASFLSTLKKRLHVLLQKQELSFTAKEWMIREALNLNALQEGGTFRHTLWKRIQRAVTPLLALIISIIDRDRNLDLLINPQSKTFVKKLWLDIFSNVNLLDIPHIWSQNSSESGLILVQNNLRFDLDEYNFMPFSGRVKDYLDELWVQTRYMEGYSEERFVEIFRGTDLGQYIAQLSEEEQGELFHWYLRDFLLMTMHISSIEELQVMQWCLVSCVNQLKNPTQADIAMVLLPWVHLAYDYFKTRLQNLSRIIALNPHVIDKIILNAEKIQSNEMSLDLYCAQACIEMAEFNSSFQNYNIWLQQVRCLKTPVELICADESCQSYGPHCKQLAKQIASDWNRLYSMALFVEHILLESVKMSRQLKDMVVKFTELIGKCLVGGADLKTIRPFEAVIDILCQCKNEASQQFSRYGLKECPICLGDPENPSCLPCEHIYCMKCIQSWLAPGQMNCPFCKTDLPDNYELTGSEELRSAIKKNADFRQLCNKFFIDLASTMCFKDNFPPDKDVIQRMLSLLFIQKESSLRLSGLKTYTKSLSPFDDTIDKNPMVRSVMLKLLLKYSFPEVKEHLQSYLHFVERYHILFPEEQAKLYALFVNCFEDSMYEKIRFPSVIENGGCLYTESSFLLHYLQYRNQNFDQEVSVDSLKEIARIRFCLDMAAELLFALHTASETELSQQKEKVNFLERVRYFCIQSRNEWFRAYLVRKLNNRFGMEFVHQISKSDKFSWVFPEEILQQQRDQSCQIDRFLVHGDDYRLLRDELAKAVIECKTEGVLEALHKCKCREEQKSVYFLLAVFREVTVLYGSKNTAAHPKPEQLDTVAKIMQDTKFPGSDAFKVFATGLLNNLPPELGVRPEQPSFTLIVIEMLIHTAGVLLCGTSHILTPLKNLAFSPANMENSYLPTMPEDMLAEAAKWQALGNLRWYVCPNGHPCTVGECGQPMERSRCVDCGVDIGGLNHAPVHGFTITDAAQDRTRSGHILGDARMREAAVAPDRQMSSVSFLLIRLLTHMAMMLGGLRDPQAVGNIIKPSTPNCLEFLLAHISKDIDQLTRTLGKSIDETTNVVHLILRRLLQPQQPNQWLVHFDPALTTKQKRNNWEMAVVNCIITGELKDLDRNLMHVNMQITQDQRISTNPVVKIVYGDPKTFLSNLPQQSALHCNTVWSCRERISLEYLAHLVEQKEGKDTVPVLWKFLQKDSELRFVQFLPELLALQRDLVKRFQNVSDVKIGRIADFLLDIKPDSVKQTFQNRIQLFLRCWNHLRTSLATNGEIKIPQDYCAEDLGFNSDFSILLPRRHGLGLCSTALISYLISLHNDMVYAVEKYTTTFIKYSINPSDLAELHVIKYDAEQDMVPVILSNCQYSLESKGETLQDFNLEKIEQQICSRFLQGKPLITLTGIPTLVYRQDRNYENMFKDLKAKVDQESLPNSVLSLISGELHSYSDVCESLSVVEVTLGFLAMAGGDSNIPLVEYVKKDLRMEDQVTQHIEKALSRCSLKHSIALWQLLSSRKSESMLRLKRDPFDDISPNYKKELKPEQQRSLNTFLSQTGFDTFILELHEMFIMKLKNIQSIKDFNPCWSLRETLFSYIEGKGVDVLPELVDTFPEEILLSQCIPAWKVAVAFKQDRLQR
ncbi:E3 ubiquitin-protein ligase RNF213 [Protopterus annectens]|uniref:E3 ubiquitin-protein ligase RNF213 n=1 Tax=Protopterus annectens TaxID=7888 RepID=UPI001CFB669A|nr:E3 ubiquitin-protein ligase RNF213 [Protopterus annectens]